MRNTRPAILRAQDTAAGLPVPRAEHRRSRIDELVAVVTADWDQLVPLPAPAAGAGR